MQWEMSCADIPIMATRIQGWSALHWAAKAGSSETVQLLLEVGFNPHIKSKVRTQKLDWLSQR